MHSVLVQKSDAKITFLSTDENRRRPISGFLAIPWCFRHLPSRPNLFNPAAGSMASSKKYKIFIGI